MFDYRIFRGEEYKANTSEITEFRKGLESVGFDIEKALTAPLFLERAKRIFDECNFNNITQPLNEAIAIFQPTYDDNYVVRFNNWFEVSLAALKDDKSTDEYIKICKVDHFKSQKKQEEERYKLYLTLKKEFEDEV